MRELQLKEQEIITGAGGLLDGKFLDAFHGFVAAVPIGMTVGSAVAWRYASGGGLFSVFSKVIGQAFGLGGGFLYSFIGLMVGYEEMLNITDDWMKYLFQAPGGDGPGNI